MSKLRDIILNESKYSKERSDSHGEVFTPFYLIEEMLDKIPVEWYSDSSKTFLDPCAGKGNFTVILLERLMKGLSSEFPDKKIRYKHIMENQIHMCEFQRDSAEFIEHTFNPNKDLNLNLYVGDTLKMPDDFFDLDYDKRLKKYPHHCVNGKVPNNITPVQGKALNKPLF